MSLIIYEIDQLYQRTFGSKPYRVPPQQGTTDPPGFSIPPKQTLSLEGSNLIGKADGQEIWLPTKFVDLDQNGNVLGKDQRTATNELFLPYSVIRISGKKTIVKTPLAERRGTVKELFSIDDYSISIKGFLIDMKGRVWPDEQIKALKKIYERNEAVQLDNALTNIFLETPRVVIESLEFPEVEGGRKHIRPFSMTIESDSIFELELK